ncbi:MAG: dihydroorotate dehydrogenase electron transfer subunit [Rhodopirellula sp.]|nr:dihydroorotate dehydrogenase electron transfer subunit [Rhodopirellula sp.]
MNASEHHVSYADRAWHGTVTVEENIVVARDTYRLRFRCPEIAGPMLPGQFIMIRLPGSDDPLLGRPLAVYDTVDGTSDASAGLDIVYLAIGKMTRRLALFGQGQPLEVWGPLGNGFPPVPAEHLILVAGGIGQTPFLALAKEYLGQKTYGDPPREVSRAAKVSLCYGVRSKDYLAGVADFERIGVEVHVTTDDGSAGRPGFVTDLIRPVLARCEVAPRIVCCGPEAMMAGTAKLAKNLGVPCQVSLETPMACGIGICFSCVAKVRDADGAWDYRRTCVEGPVFDAEAVEFPAG